MPTIDKILLSELEALRKDIIERNVQFGSVASGRTNKAFSTRLTGDLSGVLEGATYAGVLQRGRKPGKVPNDMVERIKEWIIAKGLAFKDEKDLDRFANSIKWSIIKFGSKLYRTKQEHDVFDTPIADFENRLASEIAAFYEAKSINEIFNK